MGNSAILALVVALAASVAAESVSQPWRPVETGVSVVRRQDVPDDCTFFEIPASEDEDCEFFAARWGITVEEFISWNPSVGADCDGIEVGKEYCVERNWGMPIPPTSTTTTTTATVPTGTPKPSPTQPGLIDTCTTFYKAVSGDSCDAIVSRYGTFTLAQFKEWNPAVGDECRSLWADTYYCVGIPGTPTSRPTTTLITTTTTAGVPKPSPTQPGLVESCVRFYKAVSGDTCDSIVSKYGTFTVAQFKTWNPAVGSDCRGLWADTYYCVGIPGTPTTTVRPTTTTSTTTRGNGIATPSPTQPTIVNNCNKFYLVKENESCDQVAAKNGITVQRLTTWNPSVGSSCSGLWANAYACVSIVGYTPPLTTTCSSASTDKTWGGNLPAALSSAVNWCDGKDVTDGSGIFTNGHVKNGCFNAPLGTNKFQFSARNSWGITATLTPATCERMIKAAINNCERGGSGTLESWSFKAVVTAGQC